MYNTNILYYLHCLKFTHSLRGEEGLCRIVVILNEDEMKEGNSAVIKQKVSGSHCVCQLSVDRNVCRLPGWVWGGGVPAGAGYWGGFCAGGWVEDEGG